MRTRSWLMLLCMVPVLLAVQVLVEGPNVAGPPSPPLSASLSAGVMVDAFTPRGASANVDAGRLQEEIQFEVYCGKNHSAKVEDYSPSLLRRLTGDRDTPIPCLCGDPELPPGATCLSTRRKNQIEQWATQVFPALMRMGFPSPIPHRLGPVVQNAEGETVVRLYADHDVFYATTLAPCAPSPGRPDNRLAVLKFNPGVFESFPEPLVFRMLVHELVHVLQHASAVATEPDTDNCPLPEWVLEGPADAVSVQLMNTRYPQYKPALSVKGSRSVYGLRPWWGAFTWENTETVDREKNAIVPQYTASSFWTYLAERFKQGEFAYLSNLYSVPDLTVGRDDWLHWLDTNLRNERFGFGRPLYLLFPDFIAYYASWGKERYPHLGEETWLEESFGKGEDGRPCRNLILSPVSAKGRARFELDAISAQCVRVKVEGLLPGEEATIKFMAYDDSQDALDNLHMSLAYGRGRFSKLGRDFNCYLEASKGTAAAAQLCFMDPFLGRREAPSDVVARFAKAWVGDVQQATDGTIENLYLVSHVPVNPTDAQHAQGPQRGRRTVQRVELSVAVQVTRLATSIKGEAKQSRADVNTSGAAGPVFGAESALSGVVKMVDPEIMSQVAVAADAAPGGSLAGSGLRDISVHDVKPGSEEADLPELTLHLQLRERPLTFGSRGTYTAYVSGTTAAGGGRIGAIGRAALGRGGPAQRGQILNLPPDDSIGSATIEVLEYSDDLLHLRVSGAFCTDYDFARRSCRKSGTFESEVVKPFGWTFDDAQRFVSIETPGMAEYRSYYQEQFGGLLPGLTGAPPIPGAGGPGPGGDGGGALQLEVACTCSCEEFEQLQEKAQEASKRGGRQAGPTPEVMQLMTCNLKCNTQYAACHQKH